ncbi:hypothetical protein DRO30_01325 [Candidatus Bathyarchaeota archaeon]|nr:MAG: hypothetical protein DRO30_01325 [Candidatus Bathyarchaeota archaeon]
MPKKYILNSAVITLPGLYEYRLISVNEARKWLKNNDWESTIGYIETASALATLAGIPIPLNRKLVRMMPGDEALVFRLTCRLENPELKGKLSPDFVLKNCEIGILKRIR